MNTSTVCRPFCGFENTYWSEWQDLNLRPPRPERGTRPPYSVRQQRLSPLFEPPRQKLSFWHRLWHPIIRNSVPVEGTGRHDRTRKLNQIKLRQHHSTLEGTRAVALETAALSC